MKRQFFILTAVFFLTACNNFFQSEKFDSHLWKSDEKHRYQMINEIIENQLLIGKTKQEVIELLGKDSEEGPCKDCLGYSTNEPDQGFSIDHEVLEINFNKQNEVTDVRLNAW